MIIELEVPDRLQPETQKLVADFARACAEKLYAAQEKIGFRRIGNKNVDPNFFPTSAKVIRGTLRLIAHSCGGMVGRPCV